MLLRLTFCLALFIAFPLFLIAMILVTLPSSHFIRVYGIEYDQESGNMIVHRQNLVDNPFWVHWRISVEVPPTCLAGATCIAEEGQTPPRENECFADGRILVGATPAGSNGQVVIYHLPDHVRECLDSPGDKVVIASWQVLLAGWFPLRPTDLWHPPREVSS